MAWNPSPDVAVARDAAARLEKIHGSKVAGIVVLYYMADARLGFSSYGPNRSLCQKAGELGEKLYDRTVEHFTG